MFVSILVLLEVALRHLMKCMRQQSTKWVSILVLLEVALRQRLPFPSVVSGLVSILVLLEVALRRWRCYNLGSGLDLFQSLFYWKLLCDYALSVAATLSIGFNPCFIGSCSATNQAVLSDECFCWFQSLFYWKLLCDGENTHLSRHDDMFQSLFYWKLLCDVNGEGWTNSLGCFNPCFIGSCSATIKNIFFFCCWITVSILVLLEVALRLSNWSRVIKHDSVSILVLLEVALRQHQ